MTQQITIPLALLEQLVGALEGVEALIAHQYTGTREAMNALQNASDDAQEALTAGRAALEGEEQTVVDKAWARFCGLMGEKAPYPEMINAFEKHYGQSFKDKDWRNEASVWAQAWQAATRYSKEQQP